MSSPLTLQTGARVGAYEVRGPLGAGGMGEVYRAWDERLGREVALKVLPQSVANDPERLRRFEQEARAAGTLNHPNILAVYDAGSHESLPYIVSELLEGETLRERIRSGALTPRKAVEHAIQIARGLAAAHLRGIVHRDLKPENVFVTRDGQVKILDFGLAKLREATASDSERETATQDTRPGVIMGTIPYMSPEQLRGLPTNARSDIFALGSVLYEMLARRRPFEGETTAEIEAAILREEPKELPPTRGVPTAVDRIVRRCLEKKPEDRFETAHDVAFALEAVGTTTSASALPSSEPRGRWRATRAFLPPLLLGLLIGASLVAVLRPPSAPPSYTQLTFRRGTILSARFTHDGQTVVYSAAWDGQPAQVYATRIGSNETRALDIEGIVLSVSSKDEVAVKRGRFLRRFTSGRGEPGTLARVSLAGGAPRDLLENVEAADWDPEGKDLAVLRRVEGNKRLEYPIGHVVNDEDDMFNVRVLPGGRFATFDAEEMGVGSWRFSLWLRDRAGLKTVLSRDWTEAPIATWSPATREILFVASREGDELGLHAVSLAGRERLVARLPGNFDQHDVDPRGRLLLEQRSARGKLVGLLPGETQERDVPSLQDALPTDFSADGRRLLVTRFRPAHSNEHDLFLRNTDGSPAVQLGAYFGLALSPDGRWALALPSGRDHSDHLVLVPTGAGEPRDLRHASIPSFRTAAWFPDGRRIAVVTGERRLFVWDVDMKAPPLALSGSTIRQPVVSPDGRSVAAAVANRGLMVYPVDGGPSRPLPGGGEQDQPLRWSSDGRWLYVSRTRLPQYDVARAWIDRIEMATGRREPWKDLTPGDRAGVGAIFSVHITPDGKSYVYSLESVMGDLYLAEGLR